MRFFLSEVSKSLVCLSVIYLAMYFLDLEILYANAFGYSVLILLGFILKKSWVFNNHNLNVLLNLFVLAIAYAANLAAVLYASANFELNPYLAQALGIIPFSMICFLGGSYFAASASGKLAETKNSVCNPAVSGNGPLLSRPIKVAIVVPCYNEELVLPETTRQLADLLQDLIAAGKITTDSRVYYVDDGSRDQTWHLIESLSGAHGFVHGIKLSRNHGHQNALLAGILTADGEVVISVDADLQDDLSAIKQMIEFHLNGYDIVYGVRDSRQSDTFFKRFTAIAYYQLLNTMGVEIIFNHADYRLLSRRVIEALREFGEVNLFLRGIIPQLGFSHSIVYYDRVERFAGESKYPLRKMLAFAWQGITSFSNVPLRFITVLGLSVSCFSFLITVWAIGIRLFTQEAIPGWASTVLPIYFLGGIQLLCLGIMGEYLGKIYLETKRRPRFFIEKTI